MSVEKNVRAQAEVYWSECTNYVFIRIFAIHVKKRQPLLLYDFLPPRRVETVVESQGVVLAQHVRVRAADASLSPPQMPLREQSIDPQVYVWFPFFVHQVVHAHTHTHTSNPIPTHTRIYIHRSYREPMPPRSKCANSL